MTRNQRELLKAQAELAEKQEKEAAARADVARANLAELERAYEMRRKEVLGNALIVEAANNAQVATGIERIIASLTAKSDKLAFEGWTVPRPPAAPEPEVAKIEGLTHHAVETEGATQTGDDHAA